MKYAKSTGGGAGMCVCGGVWFGKKNLLWT